MIVMVEVTDILADAEIKSELRDYNLHGDVALGGMAVKVLGTARLDGAKPDGYGGYFKTYRVEEL